MQHLRMPFRKIVTVGGDGKLVAFQSHQSTFESTSQIVS